MSDAEKLVLSAVFAMFMAGMISIFVWFPVSHAEFQQMNAYNLTYTYHRGREHVADLLGDAGEIRAEVWFDYDKGHEIYLVKGKFQDKMPTKWWRRRSCR